MPYTKICPNCNQEYLTKDKRQKYCKRSCYCVSGEKNPFYGRKHSEVVTTQISQKLKGKLAKEKNPFFGKKHSLQSIERMSTSQKHYFKENKEKILDKSWEQKGHTKETLQEMC